MLLAQEPCAAPGCQGEMQVWGGEQAAPVGARHWGVLPAALSSHVLPCVLQPENLLVWDGVEGEEQVRICDFGNAQKLTPGEPQYTASMVHPSSWHPRLSTRPLSLGSLTSGNVGTLGCWDGPGQLPSVPC